MPTDPRALPLFATLALTALTACTVGKSDDDDDDDDQGGGGWDLGTDTGTASGGDGGGDGGGPDGGADGGGGDGGGGDGGGGDGGGGDGGGGDGGGGDGGGDWALWCNAYAAIDGRGDTERVYDTLFFDGARYEEQTTSAWDARTGTAVVERRLAGGDATIAIDEQWACDGGVVTLGSYTITAGGRAATMVLDEPLQRFLAHDDLTVGRRWSQTYTASSGGLPVWEMQAAFEVVGTDVRLVDAGRFDILRIEAEYERTDLTGSASDATGTVTWDLAPGLGLVYSQDRHSDGTLVEERELTSYGGAFLPFPPDAR
ncbi:hypothetical protein L6R53_02565 [Myxococcota bacterium]|nr:hypothetical protein [Myxococcota bacterium]